MFYLFQDFYITPLDGSLVEEWLETWSLEELEPKRLEWSFRFDRIPHDQLLVCLITHKSVEGFYGPLPVALAITTPEVFRYVKNTWTLEMGHRWFLLPLDRVCRNSKITPDKVVREVPPRSMYAEKYGPKKRGEKKKNGKASSAP